jgi:hypothetical protein
MLTKIEKTATARTVLLNAAELIRTRGWCQDRAVTPDGRLCLIGALVVANSRVSVAAMIGSSYPLAHEALNRLRCAVLQSPGRWNDAPGRTAAEVIALLEQVALDA